MVTPFEEGRAAGYKGVARDRNPYTKGLAATTEQFTCALEWIRGHIEGQNQVRDDVIAKHREGTR